MGAINRPTFSSDARKRIYEYVERHGTVKRDRLIDVVSVPSSEFQTHIEALVDDGYITEDGGTLRLAFEFGAVQEYEIDGLEFVIRPAHHDDFDGLIDVIRDVTAEETYVVAETIAEQLLYEDTVTRHNTVTSRVFFVATVDGDVVGWTHLDLPQIDHVQEVAQQTVGVAEVHRGHGIGSKLLHRGIEWAEANGYRKVYNSVPIVNERALEFLTTHGWDTEAIRRNHYTIGQEHVDEVIMTYEL